MLLRIFIQFPYELHNKTKKYNIFNKINNNKLKFSQNTIYHVNNGFNELGVAQIHRTFLAHAIIFSIASIGYISK